MKKKLIKKYIYEGLGFPIILKNVPTIEIRGEIVPDINYNELQKAVIIYLCNKETALTGSEIKFIRKYFEMTSTEFGAEFGCSHTAVLKWEKNHNHPAKAEPTTDICIRLFCFYRLHCKSSAFKELYDKIQQLAKHQKKLKSTHSTPISIDLDEFDAVNC